MFAVNEATGAIEMNVGDTGAFEVQGVRSDGDDWAEGDRAIFTVRNGAGVNIITRYYPLDDDDNIGNGIFLVQLHNADTDSLEPGSYTWEVRFVANPYYDSDGRITDGDIVRTPGVMGDGNPMSLTLKPVQADI